MWYLPGLNWGHQDFQSCALPTELRYQLLCFQSGCKDKRIFLKKKFFQSFFQMIVKKIGFALVVPLIILAYLRVTYGGSYGLYMIPFGVLLITLYMFIPQVEWWWAKRNPPKVSPELVKYLNEYFTFFQELSGSDKDKFLERITLFDMARAFMPQVGDKVPTPIKTMVCAEGVRLTFGLEDYLLLSHERVVIYPHPFPSPQHRQMHHSETYHKDGVLIFDSSPVIAQFKNTAIVFNIVLYEWVSVFKYEHKSVFPAFEDADWTVFGERFNTPKILVAASLGLPTFDMSFVGAVLYLTQKTLFVEHYPMQAEHFSVLFKQ